MKATSTSANQMPREHYLNATYGIRSWLLTTDHKRIALLYLVSVTFFLFYRRRVCHHDSDSPAHAFGIAGHAGNLQQAVHHARCGDDLFFLIPSIPAVLGNFLLPIMIGAKDLAFRRSIS